MALAAYYFETGPFRFAIPRLTGPEIALEALDKAHRKTHPLRGVLVLLTVVACDCDLVVDAVTSSFSAEDDEHDTRDVGGAYAAILVGVAAFRACERTHVSICWESPVTVEYLQHLGGEVGRANLAVAVTVGIENSLLLTRSRAPWSPGIF